MEDVDQDIGCATFFCISFLKPFDDFKSLLGRIVLFARY